MANWQVHRFGDLVAISTGSGGHTIYLIADEANKMARAITRACHSVRVEKFSKAPSLTISGAALDPGKDCKPLPVGIRDGNILIAYETR